VNWGPEDDQTCRFGYAIADDAAESDAMGFRRVETVCVGAGLRAEKQ